MKVLFSVVCLSLLASALYLFVNIRGGTVCNLFRIVLSVLVLGYIGRRMVGRLG